MNAWADFEHATTRDIVAWAADQPWAHAMSACVQDAEWHAEGDVWAHTCMVVAELERLSEWPSLNREDQLKLLFTAFFHDAGKPATTVKDPSTGRTHSPKHALVSTEIARNVLRSLGCPLAVREAIAAIVRYHGRPPYLLEKTDPAKEVITLSWHVRNELLYLFALADTRGRDTREMARPEDNLHLWRMVAEEQECFTKPFAFANDQARFLYFRDELSSLHYAPREQYRCTVMLMSGLPGAGKDTWLARHRPSLPVVSLDDLRGELEVEPTDDQGQVIQAARERCRERLRAGRDFAFNATNIIRQTRKRWIDLFADYAARIEIAYIEPPLASIFGQNDRRNQRVPRQVIEHLARKAEPPTWTEAHSVRLAENSRDS